MPFTDQDFHNPKVGTLDGLLGTSTSKVLTPESYDEMEFGTNTIPLGGAGKSKYDFNLSRQNIQYMPQFRAENQPGIAQLGNAVAQSAGQIIGGTLEGIGYLGDVPQTVNAIAGVEQEWGNWLSDIGKNLQTWTQDVAPIYQDPEDVGKFRPNKWSWWMSNAPSVASTLSLLIPAAGTVKGVSMLGKALGVGSKLGTVPKAIGTVLGQATVSRLMENGMEASSTYERTLNDLVSIGIPIEKAKAQAGMAASDDWNKNWILMLQDIPSYAILGGTLNKATKELTIPTAKFLGKSTKPLAIKRSTALLADALSEGGEEVYQYVVSDRAANLARAAVDKDYEYKPSVKEYIKDGELWNSFVLGALGSTVFQTAGRKVNDAIQRLGGKETEDDIRIKNFMSWSGEIKLAQEAVKQAKAKANPVATKVAMEDLAVSMAANAAELGNVGQLIDTLTDIHKNSIDPKTAEALQISPDQQTFIKEHYPTLIQEVQNTVKAFESYAKKYSKDVSSRLAVNDNKRSRVESRIAEYKKKSTELESTMLGFNSLSSSGQLMEKTRSAIKSLQKIKDSYTDIIDNDKTATKKEITDLEKKIKAIDADIVSLTKQQEEAKSLRTPEEATKDSLANLKSESYDEYVDNLDNLNTAEAVLQVLNELDRDLRSTAGKRMQGKKTERFVEPDLKSEKPTTENKEYPEVDETVGKLPDDYVPDEVYDKALQQELEHEANLQLEKQKKQTEKRKRVPKAEKPTIIADKFIPEETGNTNVDYYVDEFGNFEKLEKEPKPVSERPTKNETIVSPEEPIVSSTPKKINPQDEERERISYTFHNMVYNKKEDSPLATYINDPTKDLDKVELVYSIDYEYMPKEFGDVSEGIITRIKSGDKTLLYADTPEYNAIIDNLPIKANLRYKSNHKLINGDAYIAKSGTNPGKAYETTIELVQANTRMLRQKIVEGLLSGKEVSMSEIHRSPGRPKTQPGRQLMVPAALNINSATVELGFSNKSGDILNASGQRLPGLSNSGGGAVYIYTNTSVNGSKQPIRLNPKKLSAEDAELVFDLFEDVFKNEGIYNKTIKHSMVSGKVLLGEALNMLVYNGQSNTLQIPGSPRYREELLSKQLMLKDKYLLFGKDGRINMSDYSQEQKEEFIQYAKRTYNYPIDKKKLLQGIENPFKVGSFEVTENDIKAGYTYQQLYLDKGYLTTDVELDPKTKTTNTSSDLFIRFNDIDALKFNDVRVSKRKVREITKDSTPKETQDFMDDLMMGGTELPREYPGNSPYVVGNIESEVKWIKDNLPKDIDVEVVDDFIRVVTSTKTFKAFGSFKNSAIKLYKEAEIGTGYHEAFHAVMFLYLTPEQKEAVLNEASKKYGIERSYDQGVKDQILYHIGSDKEIDYVLKSIPILQSDRAKQIFDKGNKNGWSLEKILTELSIPKEQKQLLLDLGITDREQLALELASKYGFNVEVNTAKEIRTLSQNEAIQRQGNDKIEEGDIVEYKGNEYSIYEVEQNFSNEDMMYYFTYTLSPIENVFDPETNPDGIDVVFNINPDKFKVKRTKNNDNSSYYSNLTVPGGTNYTENEISTPLITPSIKGHAQFSTDKGIGWFRSDEQVKSGTYKETKIDNKQFEADTYNNYLRQGLTPEMAANRAAMDAMYNDGATDKTGIPTKTRRILEIQSDLFQKGRNKENLTNQTYSKYKAERQGGFREEGDLDEQSFEANGVLYSEVEGNYFKGTSDKPYDKVISKEEFETTLYNSQSNTKENQFLQLLNKDNNWVNFFIKSIIQDSAKKGYEKVLFPKGETAAKVEGHDTLANELNSINTNISLIEKDLLKKPEEFEVPTSNPYEYNYVTYINPGYHEDPFGGKISADSYTELKNKLNNIKDNLEKRRAELKSQGIEKLKPIEAFYEIKVGNILKKLGNIKVITDEYGNEWNEYTITNKDKEPILLRTQDSSYYDTISNDKLLEEKLAEGFRTFMLIDGKYKPQPGAILRFFKRLYNFIKSIFIDPATSVSDLTINGLYDRIANGEFRYAKMTPEAIAAIEKNQNKTEYRFIKDITGLSATQIHEITKLLLYQTVKYNNITKLSDIKDLSFDPVDTWLTDTINRLTDALERKPDLQSKVDLFTAIKDNFQKFKELTQDMLSSMKIHKVEEHDEDYTTNEFEKHTKESYEYSARDNMRANIKLFIATLPSDDVSPFTGMRMIVDFDTAFKKLCKQLSSARTPQEMMDRLATKAKTSLFYRTILEGNNDRIGLKTAPMTFKTEFWSVFNNHNNKFIKILKSKKDRTFTFIDSELQSLARTLLTGWSIGFSLDSNVFQKDTMKPNDKVIKGIIANYDALRTSFLGKYRTLANKADVPNLEYDLKDISFILKSIGITVSEEHVKDVLESTGLPIGEALYQLITYDLKHIFDRASGFLGTILDQQAVSSYQDKSKLFLQNSFIKDLADKVASVNEENVANGVLGPDGNFYYTYSPHCFLTNYLNNLNYDTNFADALSTVAGHRHSFFLDQIRSGNKPIYESFLGMKEEGEETLGYFDLDESDDYLFKLVALLDGKYVLPTISDKKSYGWLSGLNKIDFVKDSYLNDKGKYEFPEKVYKIFEGYYYNEVDRIQKATADIINAEKEGYYKGLIENFHFVGFNSDGTPKLRDGQGNFTGNGTRHILFPDIEGEIKRENIRKILVSIVSKEINTAIEHEIIYAPKTTTESGEKILNLSKLQNKALPEFHVNKGKQKFGKAAHLAIYNTISDYAINHVIGIVESGLLFSMDPAYYKSDASGINPFDDLTKRLSELTSPGDNLLTNFTEDEYEAGVMESDNFTSLTLQSHVFSSEELYNTLETKFKDMYKTIFPEMPEVELNNLLRNRLEAYKKVDSTDGQAYISPRMYRQIQIRLGEWNWDKEYAYRDIISKPEAKLEEIRSAYTVLLQPLKTVYYGIDLRNGSAIPVFDKMSMAILLPQMVKGTKLEALYDSMMDENQPIDMVKFNTATKVGNTIRASYLSKDNSINTDWMAGSVKQTQSFSNLRRQLITEPHEEEKRPVGIQVKKIILQNLKLNEQIYTIDDKKVTGAELARIVSDLYSGISTKGRQRLEKLLNIKNKKVNIKALYDMLKHSALQSGMPYNVIDALEENLNLDTLPDRHWTETSLTSKVGRSTIDLFTAGDSFIQMSAYATSGITTKEASDLKLMDSKGRVEVKLSVGLFKKVIPNYDKLTFEEKKEWLSQEFEGIGYRIPTQSMGSVIPFVVVDFLPEETSNVIMLPLEFTALTGSDFDIDKLFLMRYSYYHNLQGEPVKYQFVSDEDGTVSSDENLWIVYQQEMASKARAVEALDEAQKDIIKGKISGYSHLFQFLSERLNNSEMFDVEEAFIQDTLEDLKLKDLNKIKKILKEESIPFEDFAKKYRGKNAYEVNHTKALENRIIDVMKSVLTNPSHILDTKTPIDSHTKLLKSVLEELDGLRGKEERHRGFQWHSLANQTRIKRYYIGGKFGIGPFALHNVHHALTQVTNVGINTSLNAFPNPKEDIEPKKNNLARIYDRHGNLITDWLSALINAHVDIAKDPYIFRLNVTSDTYAVTNYLLRLGFGKTSFYFINQPILIKQTDPKKLKELSEIYLKEAKKLAITEGIDASKIEHTCNTWSSLKNVLINSGKLMRFIRIDTKRDANWYASQAGVALAYIKIDQEAKKLNRLVQLSRIDSKGYGNNLTQIRMFDNRIQEILLDKQFINVGNLFNDTFIRTLKENSIDFIKNIYSNVTVSSTDKFVTMADALFKISNTEELKSDIMRLYRSQKLNNELFSAFASNYFNSLQGRSYNTDKVKELIYRENSVGRRLFRLKNTNEKYKNNPFLKTLNPVVTEDTKSWLIYTRTDTRNDTWSRNTMTSGWHELLTAQEDDVRQIAEDLIDYAFFFSGFNRRLFSFFSHIPYDALTKVPQVAGGISYDQFIKQLKDELTKDDTIYNKYYQNVRDVLQNNSDFVTKDKSSSIEVVKETKLGQPVLLKLINDTTAELSPMGEIVARPFLNVSVKGKQYLVEYVGYIEQSRDAQGRASYIYKVIPTKGFSEAGHTFTEYGLGEKSIIKNNELLFIPDDKEELYAKTNVPNFIYVSQNERLGAYTNLIKVRKEDLSDRVKDFLKGQIKSLKMLPNNIQLIREGKKTATSRTYSIEPGYYKIADDLIIEVTSSTHYNSFADLSNPDAWAQSEGFENIPDMLEKTTFKYIKDFINGKKDLYIYDFRIATEYAPEPLSAEAGYNSDPLYDIEFEAGKEAFFESGDRTEAELLEESDTYNAGTKYSNEYYIDKIKEEYGVDEAKAFKQALDNYNVSEEARKLVDKMKECLK